MREACQHDSGPVNIRLPFAELFRAEAN